MSHVLKIAVLGLITAVAASCGGDKNVQNTEQPVVVEQPAAPAPREVVPEVAPARPAAPAPTVQIHPLDDPNSLLAKRKIYFDYDRSDIRDEFRGVIQAHAAYLAANPNARLTLEGHCDERGTREYNMALGERRADAVVQMMTLLGADQGQVKVISYGEERPDANGHDDQSWTLNRRAVMVYTSR